jgi:NAD(P)H dehydrogenase (quinone)
VSSEGSRPREDRAHEIRRTTGEEWLLGFRILITDATAYVGRELVRALAGAEVAVVGGTTTLAKAAGLEREGVKPAVIDFSDRASLAAAMRGVDSAFLLVPLGERMAEWAATALSVAVASGVGHVVRASVIGADVNVPFRLGRAHGMVDQLLVESGMPYTILRRNALMQEYVSRYGAGVRERAVLELPQGDGRVSLVDLRDVARAAARVLLGPGPHWNRAYDLTGPDALSNRDVARVISEVTGRTVRYSSPPDAEYRRSLAEAGGAEWAAEAEMSFHAHVRAGGAARVTRDVEEITGAGATAFVEFAREHAGSW